MASRLVNGRHTMRIYNGNSISKNKILYHNKSCHRYHQYYMDKMWKNISLYTFYDISKNKKEKKLYKDEYDKYINNHVYIVKQKYDNTCLSIIDDDMYHRSLLAFEQKELAQHFVHLYNDMIKYYDDKQLYKKARQPLTLHMVPFSHLFLLCNMNSLNLFLWNYDTERGITGEKINFPLIYTPLEDIKVSLDQRFVYS